MGNITKVIGPTLVTVPPVTGYQYHSCEGCIHFHKQRKTNTETKAGSSIHKVCHHPTMIVEKTMSLDTPQNIVSDDVTVTPDYCPLLRK